MNSYRGRLAPSPTGYLHLGHARTFWTAQERARARGGTMILRNEDLDAARFKMEFVDATLEDLRWFGLAWSEGPDVGGPHAPYNQRERMDHYVAALAKLRAGNFLYPCTCSRKDIQNAVTAPHTSDNEVIYPGTCRQNRPAAGDHAPTTFVRKSNWRFRVPDGEVITFIDGHFGPQKFVAGKDFGDFVVWRADDLSGLVVIPRRRVGRLFRRGLGCRGAGDDRGEHVDQRVVRGDARILARSRNRECQRCVPDIRQR